MKTREVVAVILRLIALYLIFQFLVSLPASLSAMVRFAGESSSVMEGGMRKYLLVMLVVQFLVMLATYVPLAVALLLNAEKLSRMFVKEDNDEVEISGEVSDNVQACAFRCVGIYAVIVWAPCLIQALIQNAVYGDECVPFMWRFFDDWIELISPAIGVLVGVWLVLKAPVLVRFVQRVRAKPTLGKSQ